MMQSDTIITSDRLLLRPFCEDDLPGMAAWAGDPAVQLEYGEPVYTDEAAVSGLLRKYIAANDAPDTYRWAILLRATDENIGQIGFCRVYEEIRTAEIEYCIAARHWGHGFAGEALDAVIRWTFVHTDFTKLEAFHRAENEKSGRVLQKSRMHLTDNVERFRITNETPAGEICYCIVKDEFVEMHEDSSL